MCNSYVSKSEKIEMSESCITRLINFLYTVDILSCSSHTLMSWIFPFSFFLFKLFSFILISFSSSLTLPVLSLLTILLVPIPHSHPSPCNPTPLLVLHLLTPHSTLRLLALVSLSPCTLFPCPVILLYLSYHTTSLSSNTPTSLLERSPRPTSPLPQIPVSVLWVPTRLHLPSLPCPTLMTPRMDKNCHRSPDPHPI